MKNREIIENVRKILLGDCSQKREVSGQNGRVGISVECHKKSWCHKKLLLYKQCVCPLLSQLIFLVIYN